MTDYERGVEQASACYQEVIREYVAENAKLRELVSDLWSDLENQLMPPWSGEYERRIRELGIEVTP